MDNSNYEFIYRDDSGILVIDKISSVVKLKLKCEQGRTRNLGCIARNSVKAISYYKTDEEAQTFRKNNSWSINWNVLNFLPPQGTINIKTETTIYRMTKETALSVGGFLWFKDTGIERKFYIPKDLFIQEPVIKK